VTLDFLGPDDILVTEKDKGTVQRLVNRTLLSEPVLDVPVATISSRGLLGIAIERETNSSSPRNVYLYFTESATGSDGDDSLEANGTEPLGNRLYKYQWKNETLSNPTLLLDLPVGVKTGVQHNGGIIRIGPDGNVYLVVGDLHEHRTKAQNLRGGPPPDGTSAIYRISKNGSALPDNPLGAKGSHSDKYYAYGIRNGFGLDFDPITGNLWDTENGPHYGDEINLVKPGFNSGWKRQMAFTIDPYYPDQFVDIGSEGKHGNYSDPEFVWDYPIGVTALTFLNSSSLGKQYSNDMFVGDVNYGNIYDFDLIKNRTGLQIYTPLADRTAQNQTEMERVIFGQGFGRISDIKQGPDGYLYVLDIGAGRVWRIIPTNLQNATNESLDKLEMNSTSSQLNNTGNTVVDLIDPGKNWEPIYDVDLNRSATDMILAVDTNRTSKIYNRVYLNETISFLVPPKLDLVYSSNSINGKAVFAFEILDSSNNSILLTSPLNETLGKIEEASFRIPQLIGESAIEFRLYIITEQPGRHILDIKRLELN
jgi:glucose/arabinose dehydrogenase